MSNTNDPNVKEEAQDEQGLSYDEEWEAQWGASEEASSDPAPDEDDDSGAEDGADVDGKDDSTQASETTSTSTPLVAPQSDDPFGWIKALPEEVREQAEQLRHSALSDQGRVAAYNKQLAQLRQELDAAKQAAARPAAPAEQKPSVSAAPELSEKFKQLKEDFPEFAEAVEEIREIDRLRYEARLTEALSPIEQMKIAQQRADFDETVTTGVKDFLPDAPEWDWRVITKEADFHAWLKLQPQSMNTAARSSDPQEALNVLRRYKQDYDAAVAEMQFTPDTTTNASTQKADDVKQRRTKLKNSSVVPGSKPVPTDPNAIEGDYDAMFNARWG